MKYILPLFFIAISFAVYNASAQTLNKAQLDNIIQNAAQTKSDGLYILQNGKVIVEEYFGNPVQPIYIASVGKALMEIAIIKLLSDGKIKSIDQPISDFYPEWWQGRKKDITLRMILNHTSGLQNEKNSRLEIETGPEGKGEDLVKLALCAELTETPGTVFRYNNKAICLLPGIIERATRQKADHYFEEVFFKPMNIVSFRWRKDNAGTPHGHSAFDLLPADLAKFGELMLNKGVYKGKKFFDGRWVDSSLVSSERAPNIGLTWNLSFQSTQKLTPITDKQLEKLKQFNIADSVIAKLRRINNKEYSTETSLQKDMVELFGPAWKEVLTRTASVLPNGLTDLFESPSTANQNLVSFHHSGSWGNYLVIVPELKLVAVRVVKRDAEYNRDTDLFGNFTSMVLKLRY